MKKVTIRESSWHYRFYVWLKTWGDEDQRRKMKEPQGLCGYFWSLILLPPLLLFMAVFVVGVALITSPLWGTVLLVSYAVGKHRRSDSGLDAVDSGFDVMGAYITARKARVCPRVDIVRDRRAA